MTELTHDGSAPLHVRVRCAGQDHTVTWDAGTLSAVDHPDAERERALVALGAEPYRCLQLLERWAVHSDDLDVLVLAGRGVADEVPAAGPDDDDESVHVGFQTVSGVTYHGRYLPRGRGSFGWAGHHHHRHGSAFANAESLLTLDRGLADRLVVTVVDTWVRRIAEGDPRVEPARAALRAAVYGRVVRSVRSWLGDPACRVELTLQGPGEQPYLLPGADGSVVLGLGFHWLADVWQPGLAVTFGRLCLTAEQVGPTAWSLLSVGPDLGEPRALRVSW